MMEFFVIRFAVLQFGKNIYVLLCFFTLRPKVADPNAWHVYNQCFLKYKTRNVELVNIYYCVSVGTTVLHCLCAQVDTSNCYLCQGGYVIAIVCLSVCLSVSNFVQRLLNGFAWNFQRRLAMGQMVKFCWWSRLWMWIWIRIATLVRHALVEVSTAPLLLLCNIFVELMLCTWGILYSFWFVIWHFWLGDTTGSRPVAITVLQCLEVSQQRSMGDPALWVVNMGKYAINTKLVQTSGTCWYGYAHRS